MNNSAQIPIEKRVDLSVDVPSHSSVPPLVSADELAKAAEFNTPEGQAIYNEIRSMLDDKAAENAASKPPRSLARLMATTPHLSLNNRLVSPDLLSSLEPLDGYSAPLAYLTADQIDDYVCEIDASLGTAPRPPVPRTHSPTQQDLALEKSP